MFDLFKSDIIHLKIYTNKVNLRVLDKSLEIIETSALPFSSDRLVLSDYLVAESFIISLIEKLSQQKKITKRIQFYIQVMEKMEGGISPVEERSFLDLGEHCGGYKIIISDNPALVSDSEIKLILK